MSESCLQRWLKSPTGRTASPGSPHRRPRTLTSQPFPFSALSQSLVSWDRRTGRNLTVLSSCRRGLCRARRITPASSSGVAGRTPGATSSQKWICHGWSTAGRLSLSTAAYAWSPLRFTLISIRSSRMSLPMSGRSRVGDQAGPDPDPWALHRHAPRRWAPAVTGESPCCHRKATGPTGNRVHDS